MKLNRMGFTVKYDSENDTYYGECEIRAVRFSSKSKDRVKKLMREGILLYLNTFPDYRDNREYCSVGFKLVEGRIDEVC